MVRLDILACLMIGSACSASTRLHVDAALTTGANDGSSWANAFRGRLGLKNALAAAGADTDVWVADGAYAPGDANAPRTSTFALKNGVRILGGFAGNETLESQRIPAVNVAILTGDLIGDDPADLLPDTYDNAAHVVRSEHNDASAVIDGVTIMHGHAISLGTVKPVDREDAAGMLVIGGAPTVRACVFRLNQAGSVGGGLLLEDSDALIEDCRFEENVSYNMGGGAAATLGSSSVFSRCTFTSNRSSAGVGLFLGRVFWNPPREASPTAVGCVFVLNNGDIGASRGGGIGVFDCEPLIERCVFLRNFANDGGGIYIEESEADVLNCRLIGNRSAGDVADGVKVSFGAHLRMVGCEVMHHAVIDGEHSDQTALHIQASAEIINCTIAHNGGPNGGGAIMASGDGVIAIRNSILYANQSFFGSGIDGAIVKFGSPTITVDRSIVQGWDGSYPGSFNIDVDPRFVDPHGMDDVRGTLDDDLSLCADSPAIDAGDNALVAAGHDFDVRGRARRIDDPNTADAGSGEAPIVDIGAHERACMSDFNADGFVSGDDFDEYVVVFEAGDSGADINRDGFVNGDDFDEFSEAFEAGC